MPADAVSSPAVNESNAKKSGVSRLVQWLRNIWPWCCAALSGFLLALCFAFWAWFIGLLPHGDLLFLTSRRNLRIAFFGAAAWVTHEWVRGWLLSGWGWNTLGTALHGKQIALAQIAEWTGMAGPSF